MAPTLQKLILIDGHSLLNRAYFALPTLTTKTGTHTNAVYGFTLMLSRLLADELPDAVAVAFDKGAPTFRHEAYEKYKAHRERMHDELRSQLPLTKEILAAHRIPIFELPGYEADDVIGTLAGLAAAKGMEVLIVTGDKDALQLVDDRVKVMLTRRGIKDVETFDAQKVKEQLGIAPSMVVDLKGLMGDPSDNIPGVPGIGEKTALKLLRQYGSIEKLLEHRDEVKGKAGESLRRHWEDAILSKRLATIDRDVPIEVDWDALRRVEPDFDRLIELYLQLEFRTLLDQVKKGRNGLGDPPASAERLIAWDGPVDVVSDPKALKEVMELLQEEESLGVMAVWEGALPVAARLIGLALTSDRRLVYLPFGHRRGNNITLGAHLDPVRDLLAGDVGKVCHDVKAHALALATIGLPLDHVVDDTMIGAYLLNPGQGDNSLEDVSMKYLGAYPPALAGDEQPASKKRKEPKSLADIDPRELARRVGGRAQCVGEAASILRAKLREDGLERLYWELELPLTRVLIDMERAGVRVDIGELELMSKQMEKELAHLEERIFDLAGEEFNLRSPGQLARVLFDKLGLPVLSKGKTGPSTSADVLEALADEHEIVRVILDYRQVHKLKSTYVDALPGLVNPRTGRIHTTFRQEITATGRLSSVNPNLQNIPVRTAAGRRIRKAFVPREDWVMLKADYSQIELRVLAHIAGDPDLIEAFRRGEDIHTTTAAEIYGVKPGEVSPEQRDAAKAVNFGIVYGISSFGLARGTGLTQGEAKEFIEGYFQRYPAVRRYMEETVARARETGFVTTLFGRRRYLPDLTSRRWQQRAFAERTAINTPIQGSAADIIKKAMLSVHSRILSEGLKGTLVLQVHDELLFETPPDELEPLARLVKEEMEGVTELAAPLKVDLWQGSNWLEGKEVKIDA